MQRIIKAAGLIAVFLIVSCVTVNIYFPAAEVQKAADRIVDDVRTKGSDAVPETAPPAPSSRLDVMSSLLFGTRQAYAQMNIDVSTPAIRGIKESIKGRFPQLKPFYDRGAIGENNSGLLEAKDTTVLNLQERGQISRLIDQENRDRSALYREIAAANKLGSESVPQIMKIFANSWRSKSQSGWWVQDDNGVWSKR
jgi:uncharacterized protein YdbL (DUF1318 family)